MTDFPKNFGEVTSDGNDSTPEQSSNQVIPGAIVPDTIDSLKEKEETLRENIEAINAKFRNEVSTKFEKESLENEFLSQNKKLKKEVISSFLKWIFKEKLPLDPILIKEKDGIIDVNDWYLMGDTEGNEAKIDALSKIEDKKFLLHVLPDILEATDDYPEYTEKRKHMDLLAEKVGFKDMGINLQTKRYGFTEDRYELGEYKEKKNFSIKTDPGYEINTLYIDRSTQNFSDNTNSPYCSEFTKLFLATEEPYLTWKEEFFQKNTDVREKFNEINKTIQDLCTKQDVMITNFKEKEISPLENAKKENETKIEEIKNQIKVLEDSKKEQHAQNNIKDKENDLQIRNKKALLEGDENTRYLLYPSKEISDLSKVAKDLYGEELKLKEKNPDYKSGGEYHNITFDKNFENKELGVSVGLYSSDFYVDGPENAMNYSNGFIIQRADGTYNKGPEFRWRNGAGDVNSKLHIISVNNVKIVDNRIVVEAELGDGSTEDIDIGVYKLPPVYAVYRDNRTYRGYGLKNILSTMKGQNNIVENAMAGIFEEGTDIVENDFIRSIPDDALVITDNAAIRALPSLANKKIVNIEKDVLPDMITSSGLATLPYFAKAINSNPSIVMVHSGACADHAEIQGYGYKNKEYAQVLQEQLQEVFPNSKVVITDDIDDLKKNEDPNCIKVVDRHRLGEGQDYNIKEDSRTLILPLYENDPTGTKADSYVKNRFADNLRQRNS